MSEYFCKEDWQFKIYRPTADDFDYSSPEWVSIKTFISIQQKNKCARCRKEITIKQLTLHHIIKRSMGGTNDIENIIGLCGRCHNIIEPLDLDRDDITNYHKRRKKKNKSTDNDWHLWVYGGYSKYNNTEEYPKEETTQYNDDTEQTEYKYPAEIILQESYIIKERRKRGFKYAKTKYYYEKTK